MMRNIFKFPMKFIRIENTFMSPKRFLTWHMSEQRKNDLKTALELYQEGQKVAARHNNQEVTEKLKLVKSLYLSFDLQTLREVFKFFKEKTFTVIWKNTLLLIF